jgi:hypothetical protein
MSNTSPTPKRRLDPLLLPLFAGGAVLVLALGWLLITPRPSAPPLPNLGPLEARLAALEARPGFNAGLAPVRHPIWRRSRSGLKRWKPALLAWKAGRRQAWMFRALPRAPWPKPWPQGLIA